MAIQTIDKTVVLPVNPGNGFPVPHTHEMSEVIGLLAELQSLRDKLLILDQGLNGQVLAKVNGQNVWIDCDCAIFPAPLNLYSESEYEINDMLYLGALNYSESNNGSILIQGVQTYTENNYQ